MRARLRRLLEHAQSLQGDWDDKAAAWWRVTELAVDTGELTVAMEASLRAVDAYRRADSPLRVLEAVERSMELVHSSSAHLSIVLMLRWVFRYGGWSRPLLMITVLAPPGHCCCPRYTVAARIRTGKRRTTPHHLHAFDRICRKSPDGR